MPNFFETVPLKFQDVPTEPGIETDKFLLASEGLVKVFDLLGSTAFGLVKADLNGNIAKLRARRDGHPNTSATVEALVANEGPPGDKSRKATEGLLWLTRALKFTATGLRQSLSHPAEELAVSFTKAYEQTLRPHHSFVVRPVFGLAMKSCPYRKDFYDKLGAPLDLVEKELADWLSALEAIIGQIEALFAAGNWAKGF